MGEATITRAKTGNVETYKDGELVSETTKEGVSVARILIEPTESGLGIKRSRKVRTAREVGISLQSQQAQEQANLELAGTTKEARVITDPTAGLATAKVVESRTKQLAQERLLNRPEPRREVEGLRIRSVEEAEKIRLERQEAALEESARRTAIRKQIEKEQPEAFQAGADPKLILGGEFDTAKSVGLGLGGAALTGIGIGLAPTPLAPLGGGLIATGLTLSSKGAARGVEEFAGTRLTPKERELITQPQFVEAFSGAILQSQEQFRERNPIITSQERQTGRVFDPTAGLDLGAAARRVGGTLNVGISASADDFGRNLRSQLESRGFSPEQVELGVEVGQKRRSIGVTSDVIEVVGAGIGAEKGARVILGQGFTSLGTKISTTATVGALEGGSLTAGQARVIGQQADLQTVGLGAALGAVSAGGITSIIGRTGQAGGVVAGRLGRKAGSRTAETAFTFLDPSEAIVDITTTLGERGIRRTQPRTPVRPITETPTGRTPTEFNIQVSGTQSFEGFRVEPITTKSTRQRSPVVSSVGETLVPRSFERPQERLPSQPRTEPRPRDQPREIIDSFTFTTTRTQPFTTTRSQPFTSIRTSPQVSARVSPRVSTIQGAPFLTLPPRRGGGQGEFGFNIKGGRAKQYVASLAAVGLGITGEKAEAAELTGIGLRPIVSRKKSGKRRKK